jgi:predicted phosphodiesterase
VESQSSPLDQHRDFVTSLILAGLSYTDIAREVSQQLGIQTSRHSIRRFVERHAADLTATYIEADNAVRDILDYTPDFLDEFMEEQAAAVAAREASKQEAFRILEQHNLPVPESIFGDKATMRDLGIKVPKPATSKVEWGYGGAKLVEPAYAYNDDAEVVLFVSDVHFPYQDQRLVDSVLELMQDVEFDRVVLNGDINDFFQLSRFNTNLSRLDDLQDEIDMANAFRADVREALPDAVIDETEGNHDSRIRTWVGNNAKALHTLRAIRPDNLFHYDELEINWHPGAGFRLRPEFLVKHGTIVRGECPATAKAELMQAGISGISGHTHRLGTYRKAGYVQRQWTEQGGLMRLDPDYVVGVPNWTQGVVIGEFSRTSDVFRIHEIAAHDGKLAIFGGEF